MNYLRGRYILRAALWLALASLAGLWSWNILAGLFQAPQAEYRHALAAMGLFALLRWVLSPGRFDFQTRRRFWRSGR